MICELDKYLIWSMYWYWCNNGCILEFCIMWEFDGQIHWWY